MSVDHRKVLAAPVIYSLASHLLIFTCMSHLHLEV